MDLQARCICDQFKKITDVIWITRGNIVNVSYDTNIQREMKLRTLNFLVLKRKIIFLITQGCKTIFFLNY